MGPSLRRRKKAIEIIRNLEAGSQEKSQRFLLLEDGKVKFHHFFPPTANENLNTTSSNFNDVKHNRWFRVNDPKFQKLDNSPPTGIKGPLGIGLIGLSSCTKRFSHEERMGRQKCVSAFWIHRPNTCCSVEIGFDFTLFRAPVQRPNTTPYTAHYSLLTHLFHQNVPRSCNHRFHRWW